MNSGAPVGLAVVVPAFNEETLLDGCIQALHRVLSIAGGDFEILVINNGSTDATGAVAQSLASRLMHVTALSHEQRGIGGAFRTGLEAASKTTVMLWPADMVATNENLAPYLQRLGTADVLVGVRRQRVGYNALMRFNAWVYPYLVNLLLGLRLRDVNWICAYPTDGLRRLRLRHTGIPMLVEMLLGLKDQGATFIEFDVDMQQRTGGRPSASRVRVMAATLVGLLDLGIRRIPRRWER